MNVHPWSQDGTSIPPRRANLKAKIILVGYPTMREFANAIGIQESLLSRIVNGWIWRRAHLQKKIARGLGITLEELRELL